jgi:DNA-binding NtrC family response regulator
MREVGGVGSRGRQYARLFSAMKQVLHVLSAGGDEEEALRLSFADAAEGFGADKGLLLVVESEEPLRLRSACAVGLTDKQIRACERGESVKGVSSSVIRSVLASRTPRLVGNPLLGPPLEETPALAGEHYSVLCAPVLDSIRNTALAVMYFQNSALLPELAFGPIDVEWIEGYSSALGQAFALYFQEESRSRQLDKLIQEDDRPANAPELFGDSAHTQALRRVLHETYIPASGAPDPDPILILGEKGTGKDLVARYIHTFSPRRDRPFVVVNCAEITDEMAAARFFGHKKGAFTGALGDEPGFLRAAHGGMLFLDEVGELSLRAQGTLLRVLESRTVVPVGQTKEIRVDVQILLASNRDFEKGVAEGSIKADFLDRFRTQVVRLQPLRERPWDVPSLAHHFLSHHERRTRKKTQGFSQEALRLLVSYAWPGNVRELARVCSLLVTHARPGAVLDERLLGGCYADIVKSTPNPKAGPLLWEDIAMRDAVRAFKRELILSRLERHNWDVRAARESMRLPKTTFRRYARRLGIAVPEGGGRAKDLIEEP